MSEDELSMWEVYWEPKSFKLFQVESYQSRHRELDIIGLLGNLWSAEGLVSLPLFVELVGYFKTLHK
jgi:hypothetical protein